MTEAKELSPEAKAALGTIPAAASEGVVSTRAQKLFGDDARCLAMLLHLSMLTKGFTDGPFKAGWESAIEEAGAYLDSLHGDDGDQMQTLMQQVCGLMDGVYVSRMRRKGRLARWSGDRCCGSATHGLE